VRDGGLERGAHERRVEQHLGDLLLDVRHVREAIRLGDELREADQQVRLVGHRREAVEPLPQAERVREHTAAWGNSPSRNTRSSGRNTASNSTKPSG
jgi:hypothetical protein